MPIYNPRLCSCARTEHQPNNLPLVPRLSESHPDRGLSRFSVTHSLLRYFLTFALSSVFKTGKGGRRVLTDEIPSTLCSNHANLVLHFLFSFDPWNLPLLCRQLTWKTTIKRYVSRFTVFEHRRAVYANPGHTRSFNAAVRFGQPTAPGMQRPSCAASSPTNARHGF